MLDHSLDLESNSISSNSATLIVKNKTIRKKRDKYMKISAMQRDQLLERVFFQNKKVKKAASELNINYSSAKTILFLHRKKVKAFLIRKTLTKENIGKEEEKRCLFKIIPQAFIHNKVEIVTMQGGKKMFEKTAVFHGTIHNGENRLSAFNLVKKNENSMFLKESSETEREKDKLDKLKKILFLLVNNVKKD